MTNVLHIIGFLGRGGDTTVVLNVMNAMDPTRFHFDFVTHEGTTSMALVQQLREQGCTVHVLPGDVRKMGIPAYYQAMLSILRTGRVRYDAVHVHTGMQSGVALLAARRAGIGNRICHSHVSSILRRTSRLSQIVGVPVLRALYQANATKRIGCSRSAGDFLFGSGNYQLLYNSVDFSPYRDVKEEEVRALRRELGASDEDILIGHAARMIPVKNQEFVLSLAEAMEDDKHARFVFVGDGNDFDRIQKLAVGRNNIHFTGWREDIPALMTAFDCVLLPSLTEGFPVTILEAQAAGCPCLVSDNVTDEVEVGLNLVRHLPLGDRDAWLRELRRIRHTDRTEYRRVCAGTLSQMGFDRDEFVKNWLKLYE